MTRHAMYTKTRIFGNGIELHLGADDIMLLSPLGNELFYWTQQEWVDEPNLASDIVNIVAVCAAAQDADSVIEYIDEHLRTGEEL